METIVQDAIGLGHAGLKVGELVTDEMGDQAKRVGEGAIDNIQELGDIIDEETQAVKDVVKEGYGEVLFELGS